jgi:hypothetical protein
MMEIPSNSQYGIASHRNYWSSAERPKRPKPYNLSHYCDYKSVLRIAGDTPIQSVIASDSQEFFFMRSIATSP